MNIIQKLEKKYDLCANSYLSKSMWKSPPARKSILAYKNLQKKWKHKIAKNWYGFDLTERLPEKFYFVIDEFLDWVDKNNKDFQILQIKQKFFSIRIYLSGVDSRTCKYANQLEGLLCDDHIAY